MSLNLTLKSTHPGKQLDWSGESLQKAGGDSGQAKSLKWEVEQRSQGCQLYKVPLNAGHHSMKVGGAGLLFPFKF